jgi:hypothetical protein
MDKRQVGWRFPEELIKRVEEYAKRERRSVNSAAEVLLDVALSGDERSRPKP